MKEKRNRRSDLITSSAVLLVVALMFAFVAFMALPEILSEKAVIDSNPIEIHSEWDRLSTYPNRLPTYVWFLKVSETRDRVENPISYDDFKEKFSNDEIVRVGYVVRNEEVVFYGDEEISPTNIKLWKAVATPQQKLNGTVSFSNPTISESSVVYEELSIGTACMKMIFVVIAIFLFVMIPYMGYIIKKIYNDKDYEKENNEEDSEETRS